MTALLILYLWFGVPLTFMAVLLVFGYAVIGRSKAGVTRFFAYSCLGVSVLNALGFDSLEPAGSRNLSPSEIGLWAILLVPIVLALVASVCSSTRFPRPRQPTV